MLFSIGTRVKFLHSRDEGVVTELLENNMVNVRLIDSGLEIPAFIDDLIRAEDYQDNFPSVKAKIVPGKQLSEPKFPKEIPVENQYAILKSLGIQIAFDPVLKADASTEKYKVYLINDTRSEVLFNLIFSLKGLPSFSQNGKLNRLSYIDIGELLFDQLNDTPTLDIQCWKVTTEGTGSKLEKSFKIKPKQFFKSIRTAPILNKQVHLFRLFEKLEPLKTKSEDLKSYTKRNAGPSKYSRDGIVFSSTADSREYSEFIPEIDLHIENLVSNHQRMGNAEIIRTQLRFFEEFLAKAIRLGVPKVYIIHGVGKGRLRDAIASRLLRMPEVKTFKNEYHAKYGYGATEVTL